MRRALALMLDREDSAIAIIDADGHKVSANREGLSLEGTPWESESGEWSVEEIPGTSLKLVRAQATDAPKR